MGAGHTKPRENHNKHETWSHPQDIDTGVDKSDSGGKAAEPPGSSSPHSSGSHTESKKNHGQENKRWSPGVQDEPQTGNMNNTHGIRTQPQDTNTGVDKYDSGGDSADQPGSPGTSNKNVLHKPTNDSPLSPCQTSRRSQSPVGVDPHPEHSPANTDAAVKVEVAETWWLSCSRKIRNNIGIILGITVILQAIMLAIVMGEGNRDWLGAECAWDVRLADVFTFWGGNDTSSVKHSLILDHGNPTTNEFWKQLKRTPRDSFPAGSPMFERLRLTANDRFEFISEDCRRSGIVDKGYQFQQYLKQFNRIYIMEAATTYNFDRSPLRQDLYDAVKTHAPEVTLSVVFDSVDCDNMAFIMKEVYREPFSVQDERNCRGGGTGRAAAFRRFVHAAGIKRGMMNEDTAFIDVPSGLSETILLSKVLDFETTSLVGREKPVSLQDRGAPLPRKEFDVALNALRDELKKVPCSLYTEQSTRLAVAEQFPRFQVGVVGTAGAGKSTTLRWLAYYAGLSQTTRSAFIPAYQSGASFTRSLIARGMTEDQDKAGFVFFDTQGLEQKLNASHAEYDLMWLAEGRIRPDQEMKWLGHVEKQANSKAWMWATVIWPITFPLRFFTCGLLGIFCDPEPEPVPDYQPWMQPIESSREFHAILFLSQYYASERSSDLTQLRKTKAFIARLRKSLIPRGIGLVVGVTHLETCNAATVDACKHDFAENIDVGVDEVVPLERTRWPREFANLAVDGLDGTINKEIENTGMHLQPDALLNLVQRLKASTRAYFDRYDPYRKH